MTSGDRVVRRTGIVVAAGVAVVALVAYLLFTNHASATKVRDNLLAQRVNEARTRAAGVGHLFSSAAEDLRYLAESREVAAYYESRDLGMSMEYGLALALVPIRERLDTLVQSAPAPGKFLHVALVDPTGAVLAEATAAGREGPWGSFRGAARGRVVVTPDGGNLVVARTLEFKGRRVAVVVGWLRTEAVAQTLQHAGSDSDIFVVDASGRALRLGGAEDLPPGLGDLQPDGPIVQLPATATRPSALAVRVRVPGQDLSIVQLDRAELLGDLSPTASALHLAFAAVAVLALLGAAIALNTRSLVLSARLSESLRREREVADKNDALEREMAERQRLEEANAILAMAVDQAVEGIAVVDERGAIEYANAAFARMAATGADARRGCDATRLFTVKEGAEERTDLAAALALRQPWRGELCGRREDGTLFDAELVTSPVHDEHGQLVRHVVVARDVTEENRLRDRLRHSQKLEAIGTLAGGVAHDFRNLLTVMRANGEFCLASLSESHPARGDVLEVLKAVDRATNLTRQLLAFGRRQVLKPESLDANHVVSEIDRMLRRLIGERIQLRSVPCSALPSVRADRGQLEQVLVNLVVNARDAMPSGGRVTISTAAVHLDDADVRRLGAPAPGEYVRLSVSDTGCGIDAKTLPRIFEPFFTTKPLGKGTGLGLATVYGIVQQSKGFVAVESTLGAGATFDVYLPAEDAATIVEPVPARPPSCAEGERRSAETILLVEDEDQVRAALQRQLVAEGYSVLTAPDGRAASKLLEQFPGPIHLLLSDVVMPYLGGTELARIFRHHHPGAAVILMSGYSDEAVTKDGALDAAGAFVQKPHQLPDLASVMRRLLDDRRSAVALATTRASLH